MRKRGGRAKRCCKRVSRLVDCDLTGKLTDVIFSSILSPLSQRKEEQPNWNISAPLHSVLVEITRLADEKQNLESKRVGDLSRVCLRALYFLS